MIRTRLAFAGILAAVLVALGAGRQARAESLVMTVSQQSETARLQAHFLRVEAELRNRDVSGLSQSQRRARQRLLALLAGYRVQGRFPRNERYARAGRVPIFRDDHGTLCAMAYLVTETGGERVVNRLARTQNTAYLPQVDADPSVFAWLQRNGLFADEAARIQPSYNFYPVAATPEPTEGREVLLSASSLLANSVAVFYNTRRDISPQKQRRAGQFGVAAGLFGVAVSVEHFSSGGDTRWLGIIDLAAGAAALHYGLRSLRLAKRERGVETTASRVTDWSLAPLNGARTGAGGAVAFHARF